MDYSKTKATLNDLYLKQFNEKRNWYRFAVIEAFIIVVLVILVVITAMISRPYPWIVQVDEHGFEVSVGVAGKQEIDPRIVISRIGRFIESSRTVITDAYGQKSLVQWSMSAVPQNSKAAVKLNEELTRQNPYERGSKGTTVEVRIHNILPKSDRTYQANWTEITLTAGGGRQEVDYTGLFVVDINPTKKGNDIINNPLGIYITEYTFDADYIQGARKR